MISLGTTIIAFNKLSPVVKATGDNLLKAGFYIMMGMCARYSYFFGKTARYYNYFSRRVVDKL